MRFFGNMMQQRFKIHSIEFFSWSCNNSQAAATSAVFAVCLHLHQLMMLSPVRSTGMRSYSVADVHQHLTFSKVSTGSKPIAIGEFFIPCELVIYFTDYGF